MGKDTKKKNTKDELKSKAKSLLKNHPEVLYNAKDLFHNENGSTVIEDRVPRGDDKVEDVIMPRNQQDLTDKDLREMAVFASSLVDEVLLQYDERVAFEDALQRAIGTKDNGKYAGKVNASTFDLIMSNMKRKKKASVQVPVTEPVESLPKKESSNSAHIEFSKESGMDKDTILKELENTKMKLAALEVLAKDCGCKCDKGSEKEAAEKIECPTCGTKVLKATGYCLKCKKKIGESKKEEPKKEEPKEEKKDEKEASTKKMATTEIVASLDELAGVLEAQNNPELLKIAYQLDLVSDVLEGKKEASTLEGDLDEKYMKEFFNAGAKEKDSDESYMAAFDTDTTKELNDKTQKGQLGKEASSLPYAIKK